MKKQTLITIMTVLLTAGIAWGEGFALKSDDINGQLSDSQILSGFGCNGKNISPALKWANIPEGTKSFAVTVYDPDAPTGSGWWHWLIFDIPVDTTLLKEGAGSLEKKIAPKGSIQSITDFGKSGFGGACPPEGDLPHQYIFTVYALKVASLNLEPSTPPAMVGFFLNQNVIAKASLIAYYSR